MTARYSSSTLPFMMRFVRILLGQAPLELTIALFLRRMLRTALPTPPFNLKTAGVLPDLGNPCHKAGHQLAGEQKRGWLLT